MNRKATRQTYLEIVPVDEANCDANSVDNKKVIVAKKRILWAVTDLMRILKRRDPIMMDNIKEAKILPSGIFSCPLESVGVQRYTNMNIEDSTRLCTIPTFIIDRSAKIILAPSL